MPVRRDDEVVELSPTVSSGIHRTPDQSADRGTQDRLQRIETDEGDLDDEFEDQESTGNEHDERSRLSLSGGRDCGGRPWNDHRPEKPEAR